MVLIEDDTILHPHIDEDSLFYISRLNEGHEIYTRFFDALLIKRSQHRPFFRDLKAFREQPQVIKVLERAGTERKGYREITVIYLNSRFAHPWCRKTPLKKAFWRAEWGNIEGKQRDADIAKEEERLHKLLVPIWIIMRSRMFPDQETVRAWCIEERQRIEKKNSSRLTMAALQLHDEQTQGNLLSVDSPDDKAASDSCLAEGQRDAAAHAATSVLRLAAAGLIISQTPKRKLRWITKKPK